MKQIILLVFMGFMCLAMKRSEPPSSFFSVVDISDRKDEFANLSFEEVKDILSNKQLIIDTEDSVFAAWAFWLKKQRKKQFPLKDITPADESEDDFIKASAEEKKQFTDTYVRPMLPHINFSQMSTNHLAYIVPHFFQEYDPQIYIDIIEGSIDNNIKRFLLLKSNEDFEIEFQRRDNWLKGQLYYQENRDSLNKPSEKSFTMKVEFRKLSEWKKMPEKKFYSQRVDSHGYGFYFFVKKEKNGLAGYVRCVSDVEKKDHLLRAKASFDVVSIRNADEIIRSLSPQEITFNHFDRSIGLFLTCENEGETWDALINGTTKLTEKYSEGSEIAHRMSVIIKVEFLDDPSRQAQNKLLLPSTFDHRISKYVSGIIQKNLLGAHPAENLFRLLTYWIKAQETFSNDGSKSVDKFTEDYIKPILSFIPFNQMTPSYFDTEVKNFMEQYHLQEDYEQMALSYNKIRALPGIDIRAVWAEWKNLLKPWTEFLKNNASTVPTPSFPGIDNIISTLKSDLQTDSEESILYFALNYANERRKLASYLETVSSFEWQSLWETIQWNAISERYFSNIGPNVKDLNNPELNNLYEIEKKRRNDGGKIEESTRPKIKDAQKVMIKCVFLEVNTWEDTGKYYSSPVLVNGYDVYFFLQRQLISKKQEPEIYGMAGFLRVTLGDKEQDIVLPLTYQITIWQKPGLDGKKERVFSKLRVLFENSKKAIGGKLSLFNEKWKDIIQGSVPIVIDNTITAIITMDFNTNGIAPAEFLSLENL